MGNRQEAIGKEWSGKLYTYCLLPIAAEINFILHFARISGE